MLVWPLVARALLQRYWPLAADSLLDNDAAMRLEQMRDWVAGQDGLGHEQPRFAFPFESWRSRLIMASLAGMVLLFSRIFYARPALPLAEVLQLQMRSRARLPS